MASPTPDGPTLAVGSAVAATVDPATVLRTVDDRMFGVNTTVWDPLLATPETVTLLQAADLRTLRFPGGSISDGYDWKTGRSYISPGEAGYVAGVRTLRNWAWATSFDAFAPMAVALKTQVIITANYGSGTAEQAAEWVRYANVTKGYGFKYWEIGNENYGSWEEDIHAAKWDPVTYATEAKAYIAAMKAVDPTIKIGVVVQTGEDQLDTKSPVHNVTNPRTGVQHKGWTPVVLATLKSLGVTPDYVIYHRYPLAPGSETDAKLLSGVSISNTTWADDAADLRRQVNDYLGSAGANVELYVTENNDVYSDPGKQSTSLVNGLFYADSFGQLLQTEFKSFVWWALRNGSPKDSSGKQTGSFASSIYGWRTYGDYGILSSKDDVNPFVNDPHPTYYAMKLVSRFMRAGDRVVKATSDDNLLACYAALRVGGALALLVINKSPTAAKRVAFNLGSFTARASATVYSYGIPQDEAARTGTGSKDLGSATIADAGASFTRSFDAYSMSVVVLTPSTPPAPAQINGYAATATEIALTWQPAAGTFGVTAYKLERATDSAFSQGLLARTLGAASSYSDTTVAAGTTYYYRVSATNVSGTSAVSPTVSVTTPATTGTGPSRLVNISTRAYCGKGDNVTIGGFVVGGSDTKRVLMRAVGPSLGAPPINMQAAGLLADPTIEVHDASRGDQVIATIDNLAENTNAADIPAASAAVGATALDGGDKKSAALLRDMQPGVYTFVVKGKSDVTGIVLLEVYDADATAGATKFMNISTRADCTTGDGVTIGGFVISGSAPKRVLMRAVGPTLVTNGSGLSRDAVLLDPTIELHDAWHGNAIVATNDNAADNANAAEIVATAARIGASPLASEDAASSALLLTLPPGGYSFVVKGKNDTSGITLVEVYDAD